MFTVQYQGRGGVLSTHSVLSSLYQFIADQLPHFRPLKQSQRIHRCFLARNCAAITHKSCWIGTRGVSAEKIYVCQDLMACSPQIWLPACLPGACEKANPLVACSSGFGNAVSVLADGTGYVKELRPWCQCNIIERLLHLRLVHSIVHRMFPCYWLNI